MASETLKPFTMSAIERLAPASAGKRDIYLHPKIAGLILRVADTGAKSFCFVGRPKGGTMIRETIGRFPACTVEVAEAEAKRLSSLMAQGIDPRAARKKAKKNPTFGALFEAYVDQPGKRKDSTLAHYRWLYKKHLGSLGKDKAATITRGDLRALHARLTKDNGPYVANRALVLVKAVYNLAIDEERFDGGNPAAGIKPNDEESREVRLLPSQLGAFLAAVEGYPDDSLRDFFGLCLLTGQRKSNLLAMRWTDVHLADRLWIIPEGQMKNARAQNVPLMEAEVAILERRKAAATAGARARADVTPTSPWVFPSHGKSGHLVEPKAAWKAILGKAKIKDGELRIHDLRRTLGSLMGDAGVSLPTIGKTLGHMSQLTTAIYARLCLDPVREAKEKAHAVITAAGDGFGGKVVDLAAKRDQAAR